MSRLDRELISVRLATDLFGFSRQAFYKSLRPRVRKQIDWKQIDELASAERKGCPGKGVRSIYYDNPDAFPEGRDKAEQTLYELGYRLPSKQKYVRTTDAGLRKFDNLLVNKKVTGINQVWQSDMTYYQHGNKTFYSIFITDVYSQRIIGQGAFDKAYASNFLIVLNRAIKLRLKEGHSLEGLIHHSDGGKQYESGIYVKKCRDHKIKQSMCYYSWENPYAERTNGLIKNRYLSFWKPRSISLLVNLQKQSS